MPQSPEADLARRDGRLPGLEALLVGDRFAGLLRARLPELGVTRAERLYLRYKPRTNCLVAYRLATASGPLLVHGKAHRADGVEKFGKARQRQAVEGPQGPGIVVWEDLGMVLSFFPNDAKLRSLRRLSPAAVPRLLSRIAPEHEGLWDGEIFPLAYKPERRFVARVDCDGEPAAVLKLYTGAGYRAALPGLGLKMSGGVLELPRVLGHSTRRRSVATEWLSGLLLGEAQGEPGFDMGQVRYVGAALAELHAQSIKGLPRRARVKEYAHLQAVARQLTFLLPRVSPLARSLARRIVRSLARVPERYGTAHGDFYAKQVILRGEKVAILDFDRAHGGDTTADLGNYLAHLERDLLRSVVSVGRERALRESFLSGYADAAEPVSDREVRAWLAATLFRLSVDPFRRLEPDWPERIEAILERTNQVLSTVSRQPTSVAGATRGEAP